MQTRPLTFGVLAFTMGVVQKKGRSAMNTLPVTNQEQQLVYKQVGESINDLFFFPPFAPGQGPSPLLLLIPGGGWQRNEALSMYHMAKSTADTLREKGFAVASISYRGQQADGVSMREIVADIFDALAYLARYCEPLRIHPHHFYTMGHSAGAHLSLMAAYGHPPAPEGQTEPAQEPAFTLRGTAAIAPVTFFPYENRELYTPIDLSPLFAEQTAEEYRRFSPLYLAGPHVPPTYLAAGDQDDLVSCVQADLLYKKLSFMQVKARFTLSKGGDHCCLPAKGQAAALPDLPAVLREAADFLWEVETSSL